MKWELTDFRIKLDFAYSFKVFNVYKEIGNLLKTTILASGLNEWTS